MSQPQQKYRLNLLYTSTGENLNQYSFSELERYVPKCSSTIVIFSGKQSSTVIHVFANLEHVIHL